MENLVNLRKNPVIFSIFQQIFDETIKKEFAFIPHRLYTYRCGGDEANKKLIEKSFNGTRTVTAVQELDEDGRINELSRMLSGADGQSQSAVDHARSMLGQAKNYRAGGGSL